MPYQYDSPALEKACNSNLAPVDDRSVYYTVTCPGTQQTCDNDECRTDSCQRNQQLPNIYVSSSHPDNRAVFHYRPAPGQDPIAVQLEPQQFSDGVMSASVPLLPGDGYAVVTQDRHGRLQLTIDSLHSHRRYHSGLGPEENFPSLIEDLEHTLLELANSHPQRHADCRPTIDPPACACVPPDALGVVVITMTRPAFNQITEHGSATITRAEVRQIEYSRCPTCGAENPHGLRVDHDSEITCCECRPSAARCAA